MPEEDNITRDMLEGVVDDTATDDILFIDYDTIKKDGKRYRIGGLTAPEVQNLTNKGFKRGDPGGRLAAAQAGELARQGGFKNINLTGEEDNHGREIISFTNDEGEDWTDKTYLSGALAPSTFTGERERELYEIGKQSRIINEARGIREDVNDPWVKARLQREDAAVYNSSLFTDATRIKKEALDEEEFAMAQTLMGGFNPYTSEGVRYHTPGARMDNTAFSPMSAGWDQAVQGISTGIDGMKAAFYDAIDDEEGYRLNTYRAEVGDWEARQMPTFVNSVGEIKSFGDFGNYMGGLVGSAAPYLLGIMGSATAAGLLLGGGAAATAIGALPAGLVYAGQTYNDMEGTMEEKNAGIAFTVGAGMAALDMMGLRGILKPTDFLKDSVDKQIAQALMKKYNSQNVAKKMTEERALKIVKKAMVDSTEQMASGLSGLVSLTIGKKKNKFFGEKVIANPMSINLKLSKKDIAKQMLGDVREGSIKEGLTEVGQESLGYGGAVLGSNKEFDSGEFGDMAINSLIGGALIGGALSPVLGTGRAIQDFRRVKTDFEVSGEQEVELAERDSSRVIGDMLQNPVDEVHSTNVGDEAKAQKEANKMSNKGILQWAKDIPKNFISRPLNWYWDSAMGQKTHMNSEALISFFAPTNKDRISGEAIYEKETRDFDQASQDLKDTYTYIRKIFDLKDNRKDRGKATELVDELFQRRNSKKSLSQAENNILLNIDNIAKRLNDRLRDITGKASGITGEQLFRNGQPSRQKIRENEDGLRRQLLANGYTVEEVNETIEAIENSPEGGSLEDAKQLTLEDVKPRNLRLQENPFNGEGMSQFTSGDGIKSMEDAMRSLIHGAYMNKYIGMGGVKLKSMLAKARVEAGTTWDSKFATDIISSAEIWMGVYNPIKNKKARALQANITSFNLVTLLGTGGPAQLPELISAFLGRISSGQGGRTVLEDLRRLATKIGKHYMQSGEEVISRYWKGSGLNPSSSWEAGRRRFNSAGFSGVRYGAIGQTGISADEVKAGKLRQAVANIFITVSLIKPATDISRIISDGIANDAVINYLDVLDTFYDQSKPMTKRVKEAYDMLQTTRVPPLKMLQLHKNFKDAVIKEFGDMDMNESDNYDKLSNWMSENHNEYATLLDVSRKQWVDNSLANPSPGSRSRISQDPHVALLFQFRGYILTFAASILPRLIKRATSGNPNQDVQALTIMAGMIAMGFLGQVLKDEWKYEGRPYWLEDAEYVQRGFQASGLMGPFDFVLDAVNPIYGERSLVSTTQGVMGPTWGNVKQLNKILGATMSGEGEQALTAAAKLIPIAGQRQKYREEIGSILGD